MESKPLLNYPCSTGLRHLLEDHLCELFVNDRISKYLSVNECESELQIIKDWPENALAVPQIKMAFSVWSAMIVADRHAVLGKFHSLYTTLPIISPGNRKTLIFCAVFIHEFAAILAEAMEWPD
jgi:hypothetical protein